MTRSKLDPADINPVAHIQAFAEACFVDLNEQADAVGFNSTREYAGFVRRQADEAIANCEAAIDALETALGEVRAMATRLYFNGGDRPHLRLAVNNAGPADLDDIITECGGRDVGDER